MQRAVSPSQTDSDKWHDVIILLEPRTTKYPTGLGPKHKPNFDIAFHDEIIKKSLCVDPNNFSAHVPACL